MKYTGSCHCGGIKFEVEGDFREALACNCSICKRKGSLLGFVPQDKLKMLTPKERMSTYTFNKHIIRHHFCPTCGMHPYAEHTDADGNRSAYINIRCLEDVDITSIPVQAFDGRSL